LKHHLLLGGAFYFKQEKMELKKKIEVGGSTYFVSLPKSFKQSMMIDQLKIDYSDGMYWDIAKLGTPSSLFNWQLINVASYFDTMGAGIVKNLSGGTEEISVLELDLEKQKELMIVYNSEIHEWLSEYENIYVKADNNEEEGEEE
jgi:hypothetical protein